MNLTAIERVRRLASARRWPKRARDAAAKDRRARLPDDPGCDRVIDAAIAWLLEAQDRSRSQDGGVARHYSLADGWAPSYPETTGYIIPTLLRYAVVKDRQDIMHRVRRMVDWLVDIQFDCGGFQGGVIGSLPRVPVVFNTGQVLIGLAAAQRAFSGYHDPLRRAADWLIAVQDADGCWRQYSSPFARSGDKAYDAHVAWGLIEAARVIPDAGYGEAAALNLRWVLTQQHANGWFANCCLDRPDSPLTHTIGYALRGLIEGYLFLQDGELLLAARRAANQLIGVLRADGFLPGRIDPEWRQAADWVCLTGSSQIAHCWLQLFQITGERSYSAAATAANAWIRRTVMIDGEADCRGGVKGSYPIDAEYGQFQFLSWAAKFTIDSNVLEQDLATETPFARSHAPKQPAAGHDAT